MGDGFVTAAGRWKMKRMIIRAKKLMSAQERMRKILELQQMNENGIIILDDTFEIVPEPNTWYLTKDAAPTPFNDVIFCDENGVEYLGTMDGIGRFIDRAGESIKNVIAWMPAPEPYEKDE